MSVEDFWILGNQLTGHNVNQCRATGHRRFREFFGVSPVICSIIWDILVSVQSIPSSGKPCHLLWTLLFLKRYLTEHVMSSIVGTDEKTIRKWVWRFIYVLSNSLQSVYTLFLTFDPWIIDFSRLIGNRVLMVPDGTNILSSL